MGSHMEWYWGNGKSLFLDLEAECYADRVLRLRKDHIYILKMDGITY